MMPEIMPPAKAPVRKSRATPFPIPLWIASKRDGLSLSDDAIRAIVAGAAQGTIPDYQLAALLMAIVWRGLSPRELATWLSAMVASGDRLRLDGVAGKKIDKHSTGGVGDKVSLCLAPLVAACGIAVPMLAGRALGHSGGTLDKLEAIPGFRVNLAPRAYVRALSRAGWVIAGQTPRIVPADRVLYALRDATATVESIPLIVSSILSKKIAGGADGLVMDVKLGQGAFLNTDAAARTLARTLVRLGTRAGLPTVALLSDMDDPLGHAIGNALEVREAIEILRNGGPPDTRELTLRLGIEMLVLGGAVRDVRSARTRLEHALASGQALEYFRRGVRAQGGDLRFIDEPERLPRARQCWQVTAARAGFVQPVAARPLGVAATLLGAGRRQKSDAIDPGVGIVLHVARGQEVAKGQPLCTVWYNDARRLDETRSLITSALRVGPTSPPRRRLFRGTLRP